MTLIDGDRIITAQLYDDEHEEFTEKKMSIIDFINTYTDEGVAEADVVEQTRWIPMTNKRAIEMLKNELACVGNPDCNREECRNCQLVMPEHEITEALHMAIEAMEREQKTGHWIPVSERFPESCGMYIVTRKIYDCPDTAPFMMSDESWFDGQNTWHNDNRINHKRGYLTDVIAWMPLPKPYEPAERSGKE